MCGETVLVSLNFVLETKHLCERVITITAVCLLLKLIIYQTVVRIVLDEMPKLLISNLLSVHPIICSC